MPNIQIIKSKKQQLAVFIGYVSVLLMATIFFVPIIPDGSDYYSTFRHVLELNFGGEYFTGLGIAELSTIINLFVIIAFIFMIIMVPVNIKALQKKHPPNKNKLPLESDEGYTKRYIQHANEQYFRSLHGLNMIAYLRWCVAPFCALSFILAFISISTGNIDGVIRPIIAGVVLFVCILPPENIILRKDKKTIVEDNWIYDTDQQIFRERTPDELEYQRSTLFDTTEQQASTPNNTQTNHVESSATSIQTNSVSTEKNNIQLLKDYKDILDSGIISQEEYDAKKHELLHSPKNK